MVCDGDWWLIMVNDVQWCLLMHSDGLDGIEPIDSRSSLNCFQACFSQLLKLSTLLRWSFICLKCISAVQIYEFHVFISYLLHPRVYCELTSDQLPVGLIAQLVRALHWYRRGHGFHSPFKTEFFFRPAFPKRFLQLLECITAIIFHLLKCFICVLTPG